MIYHFLSGKFLHLTPQILDSILKNAKYTCRNGQNDFIVLIENTGRNIFNKDRVDAYIQVAKHNAFTNLKFINSRLKLLIYIWSISRTSKIVFHSALDPIVLTITNSLIFIFRMRKKAASISYVCWGNDFGCCRKLHVCNSFLKRLVAYIYETVWPWYGHIITLTIKDKELLEGAYKSKNVIVSPYIGDRMEFYHVSKINMPIRIMVSHSGWRHNKHIETFEMLKRFKDEDILILCPLCYGDSDYIEEVIETGRRYFGEKFHYFTELMPSDEYTQMLLRNHIYVTGAEIQTGLGALYRNMRGNAKIYLRGNLYESHKKNGYVVYNYDDISTCSFGEFVKPNSDSIFVTNINLYNKLKIENTVNSWKEIYCS